MTPQQKQLLAKILLLLFALALLTLIVLEAAHAAIWGTRYNQYTAKQDYYLNYGSDDFCLIDGSNCALGGGGGNGSGLSIAILRLVSPNASIIITGNSTDKNLSLNLTYVYGIGDARYCQKNGTNCIAIANGTDGQNGSSGLNGTGILDIYLLPNGSLQINLTNSTNITTGNLTGQKGDTGATGATGAAGATGPAGSNGSAGINGSSVVFLSIYDLQNGSYQWNFSDGTNFTTGNLSGARGPQGNQGVQGNTGDTGPAGNNGSDGSNATANWTLSNGSTTVLISNTDRVNITAGRNVTITQTGSQLVINAIDTDTNSGGTSNLTLAQVNANMGNYSANPAGYYNVTTLPAYPTADNTSWNQSYATTLFYPRNTNPQGFYNVTSLPVGNHTLLTDLTVGDPHTQYFYMSGRSGGQIIFGGIGASEDLIIRGSEDLGTGAAITLNDVIGNVGVGKSSPAVKFDVQGETQFNEMGDPINFRIETDTDQQTFFVNGSSNNVGIGTRTPTTKLSVIGSINASSEIYVGGAAVKVCRSDGTNCPADNDPWFNTSSQTLLVNNATNVSIGSLNSLPVVFVDNTKGYVGFGTRAMTSTNHWYFNTSADSNKVLLINNGDVAGLNTAAVLRVQTVGAVLNFQAHGPSRTISRWGVTLANWSEFLSNSPSDGLAIGTTIGPLILGTTSTAAIYINETTQNIGFGATTTPEKLTVTGNISTTSSVIVGGGVLRIPSSASAPSDTTNGAWYYDTTNNDAVCVRVNGAWVPLTNSTFTCA